MTSVEETTTEAGAAPPAVAADRRRAARQTLVAKAMLYGDGTQPRRILEVVSCRPHDPQTWEIGAAFVRNELAFDESSRRVEAVPRNPSRDLVPPTN